MRKSPALAVSIMLLALVGLQGAALGQPSARGEVEMAYDSESELFVLYGGLTGSFDQPGSVVGGTWVFDPATGIWTERSPDRSPPALLAANLVYDEESDLVVLWGGADPSFQDHTDVWTYDVDADVWTRLELDDGARPEHRAQSRMAYDASEDVIVLFGGQDGTDGSFPTTTWLLDIDAPSWRRVETTEGPRGRSLFGLAFEPTTDRTFLWGGGFPILNRVWAFDASEGAWEQVPVNGVAPFPQGALGMVAVPELGGLLVLGGEMQGNDVLRLFDVDAGAWSEIGSVPFGVRNRFAFAHAEGYGTLLFGGQEGDRSFAFSDETWLFDPLERAWRRP